MLVGLPFGVAGWQPLTQGAIRRVEHGVVGIRLLVGPCRERALGEGAVGEVLPDGAADGVVAGEGRHAHVLEHLVAFVRRARREEGFVLASWLLLAVVDDVARGAPPRLGRRRHGASAGIDDNLPLPIPLNGEAGFDERFFLEGATEAVEIGNPDLDTPGVRAAAAPVVEELLLRQAEHGRRRAVVRPGAEIVPSVAGGALEVVAWIGQRVRERRGGERWYRGERIKAPCLIADVTVAGRGDDDAEGIVADLAHVAVGIGEAPRRELVVVDDTDRRGAERIGYRRDRESVRVVGEPGEGAVGALGRRALRERGRRREMVNFIDLPPQAVTVEIPRAERRASSTRPASASAMKVDEKHAASSWWTSVDEAT